MFGVFFVAAAFGAAINAVQRTNWGSLFNIGYLVGSVWVQLMEGGSRVTNGAVFFRVPQGEELPIGWCWFALFVLAAMCLLYAGAQDPRGGGGAMSAPLSDNLISFANVWRFYGEILGINKVTLTIPPGSPAWWAPMARARPR